MGGGQCHLAECRAGHRGHVVNLVIDQPRQRHGADLGGPDVSLRLLEQTHVRTKQRVCRHQVTASALVDGLALENQRAMAPGRQRGIEKLALGQQHREVNRGAGGEQITEQVIQAVRRLLPTAHPGNRRHRDVQRGSGLIDGANQEGVRRQFGEDAEAVLECGLSRSGEPDGVTQVVHPVVDVAVGLLTRIERRRGVVRDLRDQRCDVVEHPGQLFEDRLDLWGVRCDVDGHLAGHDLALLPLGDDATHGFGGTTDHGRRRGGHHGDHNILDPLLLQFFTHLLGRKFDRSHGTAAGDLHAQQGPSADDLDAVLDGQCTGDDGCGDLAQRVSDDRAGRHAVGRHGGGQCDLHREEGGLNPVDTDHRLRRHHRLGDREAGLGRDHRFEFGDLGGEDRFGGEQSNAHLSPLRTLSGEHPHRATVVLADGGLQRVVALGERPQAIDECAAVVGDHGLAHRAMATAARQRVGEVTQFQIGAGSLDPVGHARRRVTKSFD